MTESLLSFSEVLLFGRVVDDLAVRAKGIDFDTRLATVDKVSNFNDVDLEIDGFDIADGDAILVRRNNANQNGIYTVADAGGAKQKLVNRV